jgi:hypothetical protein
LPDWLARRFDIDDTTALRIPFLVYAALAGVIALRYRRLSADIEPVSTEPVALHASRWVVYRLAVLFSVDSFGGGFVITALLVVWLQNRFGLSLAVSGAIFFWTGLLSAFSASVAARIAARVGAGQADESRRLFLSGAGADQRPRVSAAGLDHSHGSTASAAADGSGSQEQKREDGESGGAEEAASITVG